MQAGAWSLKYQVASETIAKSYHCDGAAVICGKKIQCAALATLTIFLFLHPRYMHPTPRDAMLNRSVSDNEG
jgi:hypothetical protein